MALCTRRWFLGAASATTTGLLCFPRQALAALVEPWCPRRVARLDPKQGLLLMVVAMPGARLDGAWIPEKYRPWTHICFPPSRKPCWCGAWHRSTDPADYLMAVGSPSREVRFASGVPGLAIVPEGARHPDGAFSWVAVPARDFAFWALRAVEQIAEGLLVPGVIGYHFDDMTLMVGTERRLQFSYAASEIGILDASARAIAQARNWLPWSSNLLVRMAGTPSLKLADLGEAATSLVNAANNSTNTMFFAPIGEETVFAIMGA
jgi:hypothetical protein